MAKAPKQHRTEWTKDHVSEFKKLVKSNTPTPLLAYKLKRTESAIRNKARDLGISLKPTNKSPYGTKAK
jgi:hypothetical protein